MFEVQIKSHFSAAHRLLDYDGDCAKVHGHNWEVIVFVRTEELDKSGLSIDFRILKTLLAGVLDELDHSDLCEHPEFSDLSPSSEQIARFIFNRLKPSVEKHHVQLAKVLVSETPGSAAVYFETE
jgi:6-pyruvoyltetrahydropterin/6-carboxytetrahydropterin synthase